MNHIPEVSIILENQPNFRSLEGIQTTNGRKFRKNMIYRSGSLNKLSQADMDKLEDIGLALVIDFRSDREVYSYPSMHIPSVKKTMRIVIPDEARDRAMEFLGNNDKEGIENVLIADYRRMILSDSGSFAEFFRILETTGDLPLVYHCAAGKDRTGLATVFLLTALGADIDTVKEDYFLSNDRLKSLADRFVRKVSEEGRNGEIIRPMMEVRPEYLEAALDEIDNSFGGLHNYLAKVLKVDFGVLQDKYLASR